MKSFAAGFVWGAATAAHQVEGGNVNSDCWALEHASPSLFREPSGDAVDQYHRFGDDMAVLAALGLGAYRRPRRRPGRPERSGRNSEGPRRRRVGGTVENGDAGERGGRTSARSSCEVRAL
jgi:hypothetical protein